MRQVTDTDVASLIDCTSVAVELTHEHTEQGSFARTVGANEGNSVVRVNDTVDLIEKNLLAEVMGDLINCDHVRKVSAK